MATLAKAIYAIFLAALFDGLDGRVARAIGAQSALVNSLIHLSDLLAFGVAPAILMYSWVYNDLDVSVQLVVLFIPRVLHSV